ncbi:MAG: hypothetical protein NDI63_02710 [Pseudobdellovibrio sp.]|nr:hypothetical protein [Pseudobdellovibrio sp.]
MNISLLIIFLFTLLIGILTYVMSRIDLQRQKRQTDFLKNASLEERAKDLIKILEDPEWDWLRFDAAKKLAAALAVRQDEREMLDGLEQIFQETVKADQVENNSPGNGSWYFYFYDCGFAAHSEALRLRFELPLKPDGIEKRRRISAKK